MNSFLLDYKLLDQSVFSSIKDKIFSMNKIWNNLIKKKTLLERKQTKVLSPKYKRNVR